MKICPGCQSSYPDGFKYCPQDNTTLLTGEEYQKRTAPVVPVAPAEMRAEVPAAIAETPKVAAPEPAPVAAYIAPREVEAPAAAPVSVTQPKAPAPAAKAETVAAKETKTVTTNGTAANGTGKVMPPQTVGKMLAAADDDLKLTLPDSGGLFSRLVSSLSNMKDVKISFNPSQWLVTRALREVGYTFQEFSKDPKGFVTALVKGEGNNARRRNILLAGSEMAAVGYVTLYLSGQAVGLLGKSKPATFNLICLAVITYLVGCFVARGFLLSKFINKFTNFLSVPKLGLEFATWAPILLLLGFIWMSPRWFCQVFPARCFDPIVDEQYRKLIEVADVKPEEAPKVDKPVPKEQVIVKGKGGFTGGSKPKIQQASGGGGQNSNAPVSKGVPPQMSMIPQVMPPTLRTPTIKNPSLVVAPTLVGDDALSKRQAGPIGLPDGADAPPSLGRGSGTGLGDGKGGGKGPGEGGNTGGGKMGIGGGPGDGGSGGNQILPATASLKPDVYFRPKAKYTEDARQNRITGTVVLQAVFTGDGNITSIRVMRGLPDGLNEEAIKALKQFKFRPAMKNGQPVSVRMSLEFAFNLL